MRFAASLCYRLNGRCRLLFISVENVDRSAIERKRFRDRLTNATSPAGDNGGFAIQSECARLLRRCQSETPLFQGMKSS